MRGTIPSTEWPHAYRASQVDSRFSYCCYLPKSARAHSPLLVVIHGSERDGMAMRDALIPFSEATGVSVLAPLFPVAPLGDDNEHGYKYIVERDLRYDRILLGMVDEMSRRARIRSDRFALAGFSGGAIFSHLFALLHADRLEGLAVCAPGHVGLIDPAHAWPHGTADVSTKFGGAEKLSAAKFPVLLLVGDRDAEPLPVRSGAPFRGKNRQEKLARLHENHRGAGLDVTLEHCPDCAHDWRPMMAPLTKYLRGIFPELKAA